jgi:hypothetical protein
LQRAQKSSLASNSSNWLSSLMRMSRNRVLPSRRMIITGSQRRPRGWRVPAFMCRSVGSMAECVERGVSDC